MERAWRRVEGRLVGEGRVVGSWRGIWGAGCVRCLGLGGGVGGGRRG